MSNNTMFGSTGEVATVRDAANNVIGLSAAGIGVPSAVVFAFPDTAQTYCSPIAGDPDPAQQTPLCGIRAIGTGFLMPKAGILTEIGFYAQGSNGSGALMNLRYNVCSLANDNTAQTGLNIEANLRNGLTSLADNFNGKVVVASGLSLAVPSQFMVFLKTPYALLGTQAQAMLSAGPIPGVVGSAGVTLVSTAAYVAAPTDFDEVTPAILPAGTDISPALYKGISVYIKWKGQ